MKKSLLSLGLGLASLYAVAQEPSFTVNVNSEQLGQRAAVVSADRIRKAEVIFDLSYISSDYHTNVTYVEVVATRSGKLVMAVAQSATLTAEQKELLAHSDFGTEILVRVKSEGGSAGEYAFVAGPDYEAQFPGGEKSMAYYVKKQIAVTEQESDRMDKLSKVCVEFTVDENGQVLTARISRSSADPLVDKEVLKAIKDMPKWRPAELDGKKVKQAFSLSMKVQSNKGC